MTVFVAAHNPQRGKEVICELRRRGASVTCDWTDGPFDIPYRDRPDWTAAKAWAIADAIRECDVFVLLWEPGEMESARWEAGFATALKKRVIVAGDVDLFYGYLPNVQVVASDNDAIAEASRERS
jgi:hypothetical protein